MSEVVSSLDTLFPPFHELADRLVPLIQPLDLYVFETYRSLDRQLERYALGRELKNGVWAVANPKLVVTNAKPGAGLHTYGLALDAVPDGDQEKQGIQWSWKDTYLDKDGKVQPVQWKTYGKIVKSLGLAWAGDWLTFCETPHAQKTYGCQASELYQILTSDGLESVWKFIYTKIKIIPNKISVPVKIEGTPSPVMVVAAADLDAHASAVKAEAHNNSIWSLLKQILAVLFKRK